MVGLGVARGAGSSTWMTCRCTDPSCCRHERPRVVPVGCAVVDYDGPLYRSVALAKRTQAWRRERRRVVECDGLSKRTMSCRCRRRAVVRFDGLCRRRRRRVVRFDGAPKRTTRRRTTRRVAVESDGLSTPTTGCRPRGYAGESCCGAAVGTARQKMGACGARPPMKAVKGSNQGSAFRQGGGRGGGRDALLDRRLLRLRLAATERLEAELGQLLRAPGGCGRSSTTVCRSVRHALKPTTAQRPRWKRRRRLGRQSGDL